MTFDAKHKKSSQAICSLRRRGGEEGIRLHFSQRTPYLKKKPCRAKNKCVHRCTHRFTHMPPACADMIRILLLCSAKRKTPSTGRGFRLANNPDFDTVTPSWKSGVSLMPKWGQVDRAWGQIVNYVNHMGSKNPAGACPAGLLFFVYLVAGLLDPGFAAGHQPFFSAKPDVL